MGLPTKAEAASALTSTPAAESPFIASGPVIVENQVDVQAQRDGVVTKISAEPGMTVKKGDLLARLDDRQLTADLDAAKAKTRAQEADLKNWQAELKVLEVDLERAQKMWEAQLITKEQLDHASYKLISDQWNVKNMEELLAQSSAAQRSLELELEKTAIRAPFDGVVARRYIRAGQRVASGERLFWVTAVAPLRVKFTLPERFIGKLKKGEQLTVISASAPEIKHAAKVILISPVVDPSSGTIEVVAELTGDPGEMRPGMTANVRLDHAP
ncbi:MAG: efflux RND transporter periplasmic adaptor subunit [Acidobacteriia bacterium]|nr:efflux RND transporter periplasmic adaptor subunit [Terriglobia bacterium]